MLTWRLADGSVPSTPAGSVTVNCPVVWPAGIMTKPEVALDPRDDAARYVAFGDVTAQSMTVSVPLALVR